MNHMQRVRSDRLSSTRRFLLMIACLPMLWGTAASWLAVSLQEPLIPATMIGWFAGSAAGGILGFMLRRYSWLKIALVLLGPFIALIITHLITYSGGYAVLVGFMTLVLLTFAVRSSKESVSRWVSADSAVCKTCGYDLRGLSVGCCPECGTSAG